MPELPLLEGILKYTSENNISLCMPGHKGGAGFLRTPIGTKLYNEAIKCDITEVDGVDNLHHPQGIIKKAEELLSRLYGSKKSYFMVNGSTGGNLAAIFSMFNENDKVIVERNCHKSIFNGIILRKLRPVYVGNKIDERYDIPVPIGTGDLLDTIDKNKDAKGIIVTYPNYYGICPDLEKIISCARKNNMKVVVDSAHGAHLGINKKLPESAVRLGADIVVMSAHKTLPSFNQSAFLHLNDDSIEARVDYFVKCFLSTSPSYMLMCSMDYARYYLEKYGNEDYEKLINMANYYRDKINSIPNFHVLGSEDFSDIDLTRYVVNVKKGLSGHKLLNYLRIHGIQGEMSDMRNVVLIFSPFNTEEHFKALYEVLKNCPEGEIKEDNEYCLENITYIPHLTLMPFKIICMDKEKINIDDANGRVCGESIIPYPPGTPIVVMGETIDQDAIDMINIYKKAGNDFLGLENGKVVVVKN